MKSEFLSHARLAKNILYIITGLVIGFAAAKKAPLTGFSIVDWIILIIGIVFFAVEWGVYLACMIRDFGGSE